MDLSAIDFEVDPDELLKQILSAPMESHQSAEPYLEILVQPKERGYRFRYSSEGNTHGGIPAEKSEKGQKQFPTIQIANYSGKAAICVTLVTADEPARVHPHHLVGKDVHNGLLYYEDTKKSWVCNFPNLGVQHVKKMNIVKVLHEKLCQQYQVDSCLNLDLENVNSFDIATLVESFGSGGLPLADQSLATVVEEAEKSRLLEEAKKLAKEVDPSVVRLCFQAFVEDEQGLLRKALQPVYSNRIYDQKAPHAGQLRICRISHSSSSVHGGQEIFLLCDKVQKEDIKVRFYHEDETTGEVTWEEYGNFPSSNVHKQYAIVLKAPPYIDKAIQKPVKVFMQLKRGKDNECSLPVPFMYEPAEYDKYKIGEKRRKGLPENLDNILEEAAASKQAKYSASATATNAAALSQEDPFMGGSSNGTLTGGTGIRFFSPDGNKYSQW